jgi:hypothetical protein
MPIGSCRPEILDFDTTNYRNQGWKGGQALGTKEAEAEKKIVELKQFKPGLVRFTQSIIASFQNGFQYMELTKIIWAKAREFSRKKRSKLSKYPAPLEIRQPADQDVRSGFIPGSHRSLPAATCQ